MRNFSHTIKQLAKQTSAVVTALFCMVTTISPISVMAADSTTYKFSDISLQVSVPDDLVGFTRNVTSNNSYLNKLGSDDIDVEELRSLMITNNIYLEAVPKADNINYEILINGKKADTSVKNFNEADEDTLNKQFTEYVQACDNIENSSVTENVTSSSIYKNDTTSYFVVDVKSVSNNKVTTYVKKYYTVMMGKSITYTLQSNENEISDEAAQKLLTIVDSAEYKEIAKSITDSQFFTEIMSSVITVLIPIAILGVIVFFMSKSTKKTKKQIEADEERYRAQYAREAKEKAEKEAREKA